MRSKGEIIKNMKKVSKVWCPYCEEEHECEHIVYCETDKIGGTKVNYMNECYLCTRKNKEFEDGAMLDRNLDRIKEELKRKRGIGE